MMTPSRTTLTAQIRCPQDGVQLPTAKLWIVQVTIGRTSDTRSPICFPLVRKLSTWVHLTLGSPTSRLEVSA